MSTSSLPCQHCISLSLHESEHSSAAQKVRPNHRTSRKNHVSTYSVKKKWKGQPPYVRYNEPWTSSYEHMKQKIRKHTRVYNPSSIWLTHWLTDSVMCWMFSLHYLLHSGRESCQQSKKSRGGSFAHSCGSSSSASRIILDQKTAWCLRVFKISKLIWVTITVIF